MLAQLVHCDAMAMPGVALKEPPGQSVHVELDTAAVALP